MLAGDVEPDVSVYGNRGQFSSEALPKQKPISMTEDTVLVNWQAN